MWVSKKTALHEPKISLVDTRSLQDKEYLRMMVPEQFIVDFEGGKPIYYDHAIYSAHESLEYSKLQVFIANVDAKCQCGACSDKGTYPKHFAATDPFPKNAAFSIDDALNRRSLSIDTPIHEREISTDASERTRSTDAKDVYDDPEETGSSCPLNTVEQDGSSVCSELETSVSFESLPSPPLTSAFRVQQSMENICIGDSHEDVGWFPKILQSINKRLCGTVGVKEVIDTEQVFH